MDKSSLFLVVAWLTSSLLAAALCSGWLIRRILIFLVQTGALTAQRCVKQKDNLVLAVHDTYAADRTREKGVFILLIKGFLTAFFCTEIKRCVTFSTTSGLPVYI